MSKIIEEAAREFAIMQWGKPILHTTGAIESLLIEFASELMKLPLADRLTDAEKEKIKQLHHEAKLCSQTVDTGTLPDEAFGLFYLGRLNLLEATFGKEFFKEIY